MQDELRSYVRQALERNISLDDIRESLAKARWRKEEVEEALSAYELAEKSPGLPVPRRKPSLSAAEAFQYLMTYLTLAISTFALGNLLFNLVNKLVPDLSENGQWNNWNASDANMAIASLLVAGPIFLLMSRVITKAIAADPAKRDSSVRKWLTYLTLFLAGGTAIGDTITLVFAILQGPQGDPLVMRFFLKVGVVLALSCGIFFHYLRDLRKDEKSS